MSLPPDDRAAPVPAPSSLDVHQRDTAPSTGLGAPLPRGHQVGRYVIQQPLGAGGMGVVYEALDPELSRKVALKLLHRDASATELARARLLREAQAMARLSHPNVVPVHDAGTTPAGEVFVAMELVDGVTLSSWLKAAKRPWREVLQYFRFAGRGLAAAHEAGLVHRDFKPDNVLVARDGRVSVTDFGLVRSEAGPLHLTEQTPEVAPPPGLGSALTHAGSLVGTPRYMAPEQLAARTADARSDQFAFCVGLYEALYGEHPYSVESLVALVNTQQEERLRPPPRDSQVPQWVRKALVRGLRAEPAHRYPTMAALLEALGNDPAVRRHRVVLASGWGLLVLVLAATGLWAYHQHERGLCTGADRKLSGVWDAGRRAELVSGFHATGRPIADEAAALVGAALDGYTRAWTGAHAEICEATRLRGEVPEAVMQARMSCLDRRLSEVGSLVGVLSHPDDALLEKAADAVGALRPAVACTQITGQIAPAEILHPEKAARTRQLLASATALLITGKYAGSAEAAEQAATLARSIDARALESVALTEQGQALRAKTPASAVPLLEQSVVLAEQAGDDGAALDAWQHLAMAQTDLAHLPEAIRAATLALAKVERVGASGTEEHAWVLRALGNAELAQGHYDDADAHFRQALALLPPEKRVILMDDLGRLLSQRGRDRQALEMAEQTLAIKEKTRGPHHPALALSLLLIGVSQHRLGQDARSEQAYRRALDLYAAALGPDNLFTARVYNNLAVLASDQHDEAKALALLSTSREILERILGVDHPSVANVLVNEGAALGGLERYPEAEQRFRRAEAIMVGRLGPEHPQLVAVWTDLGDILQLQHREAEAIPYQLRAKALAEKAFGPEHTHLDNILRGLGAAYLGLGQAPEAERSYQQALALDGKLGRSPAETADLRFHLAQAVYRVGRDRKGAKALAEAALADFDAKVTTGLPREEIVRWLAHPR